MRIQHNIMAMNAYRNYSNNTSALAKNLEKLSSGYKINRAGDAAAGLAISEKMRAQITGLKTAQKNAKDGISLIQTAEGALTEVHDMLNRALELSDQSSNGTYDELDRAQMQKELDQLRSEINRIADSTNFNGIKLLDGSLDKKISDAMKNIEGMVDNSDGMVINAPVDGAGIQETVDITFNPDDLFGAGDSLTFSVADADGNSTNITLNYDSTVVVGTGEAYTSGAPGAGDTAKFGGKTMEEQMNSIANALNHANSKLNGEYTATVKRDDAGKAIGVTLKAVDEGTPALTIDTNSVKANDVQVKADKVDTAGDNGTQVTHKAENMGWNNLLAGAAFAGGSPELQEGDTIKLDFKVNGRDMSVTLKAGEDFALGTTVKGTMNNLVTKLNATDTTFDDNATTGMDESQLKVSDYFDFTANTTNAGLDKEGSLQVKSKDIGLKETANVIGNATVTRKGGGDITVNKTIGKDVIVEAKDKTAATVAQTQANTSSVTLTDNTIDLSTTTKLTGLQVATMNGQTLTLDGVTVDFKNEDSYTGKAGEVLVSENMSGQDLLTAIQNGLNAKSKAGLEAALRDGTASYDHKVFDLSGCGAASGTINASTSGTGLTTNAYTDIDKAAALKAPTAQKTDLTFSNEFAVGEKVELRGTLSDGRTFEVTLEAIAADATTVGENQFKLGDDLDKTVANIKAALESSANKVTVYTGSNAEEVAANTLFAGTGKEFAVSTSTSKLSIESAAAGAPGKGVAARLDGARLIPKDVIKPGAETVAQGKPASKALNQVTFDAEKVEQGTTIDIDGKTYEFVTDAKFVSNPDHTAVVVGNLGKRDDTGALASDAATANDIANALKDTLDSLDGNSDGKFTAKNGGEYTVNVDAGTGVLKIETTGMGTGNVALDVAAGTAKRDAAIVKFATTDTGTKTNPSKALNVKVGDTVTINGKTYEFTDGEHRTKEEGNVGVSLKDITTAQEAAHALADAVNNSDGDKVIATVNEKDGSVVLTSKFNADADVEVKKEDPYAPPKVELPTDSNGLKLQIGDTAESFNQLTVSVQDMHAETLGIGELNIKTQDGAAAAVDALKSAINMVSDVRGTLGATQNRLDHTINNLSVMQENIQDAEASIRDVDVAQEMMEYTKNNILVQSAQAMLAQANQVPQGVLQLLQ